MTVKSLKQKIKDIGEVDYGWSTFPIIFKKDLTSDKEDCLGVVDFDKLEILLDDSISNKVLTITLIHEINHIIFSTMGIRADNEDPTEEIKITNEFVVEQATRGLLLFKKLNPDLWKVIYES